MTDEELLRYSRHILLEEVGIEGQQRWSASRALVVGAGGLGCPAALYLAGAGVGRITVVDDDRVDLTNLQRQIAHTTDRIGQAKVHSLHTAARSINPLIALDPIEARADDVLLARLVQQADVVLDCSDNFATRQAVNRACVNCRTPLVSGAAIRFDGQLAVFDARDAASPCYACVFPPDAPPEEAQCATLGVFAPLVGLVGSLQAAEALKLLAGLGEPSAGSLLLLDARGLGTTRLRSPRDAACRVCGPGTQHR